MTVYSLASTWTNNQAGVEHAITTRHDLFDKAGIDNAIILTGFENTNITPAKRYINIYELWLGRDYVKDFVIPYNLRSVTFDTNTQYYDNYGNLIYTMTKNDNGSTLITNHKLNILNVKNNINQKAEITNESITYYDEFDRLIIKHNKLNNRFHVFCGKKLIEYTNLEFVAESIKRLVKEDDILILDRTDYLEDLPKLLHGKVKIVLPIHNNHLAGNDVKNERNLNGFYSYLLLEMAPYIDKIVTSTNEQAEDIAELLNLSENKVTYIPVGNVEKQKVKLARNSQSRFPKSAVMFSRIAVDKQIDKVVEAWAKVVQKHPDAILSIYGFANQEPDGRYLGLELVNSKIEEYNLQENVLVNDYIKDKLTIDQIERAADFYLLASSAEGFNLGLMEGLQNGCVGISTDVKYGPNELIKNGETGIVVEYNNFEQLSDSILELIDNTELKETYRSKSLDYMLENYEQEVNIKRWKEVINDISSK